MLFKFLKLTISPKKDTTVKYIFMILYFIYFIKVILINF